VVRAVGRVKRQAYSSCSGGGGGGVGGFRGGGVGGFGDWAGSPTVLGMLYLPI